MASSSLVAIVTGAAQGLGFAVTERLLQEGYKVCAADVNEQKGKKSVADLQEKYGGNKVIFSKCDVTSESNFEEVFHKTQKEFGRIDLLVNNAGTVDESNPAWTVQLNLLAPIIGCQLALKFMGTSHGGKGGVVINVASIVGLLKSPFCPVYSATKHGIVGLTRSYGDQHHLDTNGVLFMALCPHVMKTPLLETGRLLKQQLTISDVVTMESMEPEYVAQSVIKLLKDKCNGSTLLIIPGRIEYIGIPEALQNIVL